MRRYLEIYSIMLRNSLIREMSFKTNFLLWLVVEVLWFCGQIFFFSIIFGNVDRIGDWTKWEVVLLIGTHQIISQLFQAFFFMNVAAVPELVRTGKLDTLLTWPIDSQFAVSTKQFGLDSLINAALGAVVVGVALARLNFVPNISSALLYIVALAVGVTVHYSIMLSLAAVSFWIVRAQGLVYGYFNFLTIARYPDVIFPKLFRFVFGWIIPVVIVANIPARLLIKPLGQPVQLMSHLVLAAIIIFCLSRAFWRFALRHYSSASS
ncbi:MAG TPA: ABC-2 family transporter protein [Chthoniobacterales bacterium]|nr:ABC-2 family transporter protein [Chthoniobacterales bacterium]